MGKILSAHGPRPGDHGQARQGEQRRPRGGPSQVYILSNPSQTISILLNPSQSISA
jgi:hypothetical protein